MLAPPDPELVRGEVWRALSRKWRRGALEPLLVELRKPETARSPEEVDRVLRTLLERSTAVPVRLFRHLLPRALEGDLLIDEAAEVARTRAVEAEARAAYAWDPEDPATHWVDLIDPLATGPPEPPPPEPVREPSTQERIYAFKLKCMDPPASAPRAQRADAGRFLAGLPEDLARKLADCGIA